VSTLYGAVVRPFFLRRDMGRYLICVETVYQIQSIQFVDCTVEMTGREVLAICSYAGTRIAAVSRNPDTADSGRMFGLVFHDEHPPLFMQRKSAMQVGPRIAQNKTGEQRPIEPIGYCQKDQNRIYSYS